jgi:predicted transcriptional regulator
MEADPIMPREALFTVKLEPELHAEFIAEAEAAHQTASQVLRELMREFIQRQRETREYDDFVRRKVEASRASMRAGVGRSNEDIEAEFDAKRRATSQA